ncbi:MAG: flagellar biosynthesis anti-sigma factor FlgM [Thermodesulfobacteriota bacterium]
MNNITKPVNAAGTYERQAYIGETTDRKLATREGVMPDKKNESAGDRVSLSTESKDMQTARQAVLASADNKENADSNRAEKVAGLQQAVAEGRYQINPEKIAEKLIGSMVDELV